ncbi:MAG: VOC family protein [Lacunisphaera sp.]|nr:VOC family protein [Lacunisphaera sp.]
MQIKITQQITPFLWFDHQAEPAARFYVFLGRLADF